jgi:hypothetical protein
VEDQGALLGGLERGQVGAALVVSHALGGQVGGVGVEVDGLGQGVALVVGVEGAAGALALLVADEAQRFALRGGCCKTPRIRPGGCGRWGV